MCNYSFKTNSFRFINIYHLKKVYTVIIQYLDIINDEYENGSSYYPNRNISPRDSGLDIISFAIIISYLIKTITISYVVEIRVLAVFKKMK